MPDSGQLQQIGKTGLRVTRLGLGTVALGFLYEPVPDEQAYATIQCARDLGLKLFDTAPLYGDGAAETRLGAVIGDWPRNSYVLATKAGFDIQEGMRPLDDWHFYVNAPRDFSYDGVLRNLDRSLRRLRIDRIDIVHIHDADDHFAEAMNGAYRALDRLRSEGVIQAVSAGMNQAEMLARFAREGDFDCFLLAGRYTLLEQDAIDSLFPICLQKKISVLIGGVYNSGILADPHAPVPNYNYQPAAGALVAKARRIDAICKRHGVPIKAAALQFPAAHPVVAAVLCGARTAAELVENVQLFQFPIPHTMWDELKAERLLPGQAATKDVEGQVGT
jgi:D-threo-aldose 1-dehydrogenase